MDLEWITSGRREALRPGESLLAGFHPRTRGTPLHAGLQFRARVAHRWAASFAKLVHMSCPAQSRSLDRSSRSNLGVDKHKRPEVKLATEKELRQGETSAGWQWSHVLQWFTYGVHVCQMTILYLHVKEKGRVSPKQIIYTLDVVLLVINTDSHSVSPPIRMQTHVNRPIHSNEWMSTDSRA